MHNPWRRFLLQYREERKLSQDAAGAEAGVTGGSWRAWEKGHHWPRPENIERIAEVLNLSVETLECRVARELYRVHCPREQGASARSRLIRDAEALRELELAALPEAKQTTYGYKRDDLIRRAQILERDVELFQKDYRELTGDGDRDRS